MAGTEWQRFAEASTRARALVYAQESACCVKEACTQTQTQTDHAAGIHTLQPLIPQAAGPCLDVGQEEVSVLLHTSPTCTYLWKWIIFDIIITKRICFEEESIPSTLWVLCPRGRVLTLPPRCARHGRAPLTTLIDPRS